MKRILVTGGAGYIGSHTANLLLQRGYEITIADNLSRGHREAISSSHLRVLNLQDTDDLTDLLVETRCEAVIHFAGYIEVGESMRKPELYFENNLGGSLSLLIAMVRAKVYKLVFSSTSAVYGIPNNVPITENCVIAPVSAYGESKAMVEQMLAWFDRIHGVSSMALRYFNASGADPGGRIGEEHNPETHLLPLLLRAVRTGNPITLFGDDYPTPDGTCIRDYVHVNDLAQAHILALEALAAGSPSDQFNVGTGTGHSVREMLQMVEKVTNRKVPHDIGPRRPGDPPTLVANADKLRHTLGWAPQYTGLKEIVASAWKYEQGKHETRSTKP